MSARQPAQAEIDLAERWFAELTAKLQRRGEHRSVQVLNHDTRHWNDAQMRHHI